MARYYIQALKPHLLSELNASVVSIEIALCMVDFIMGDLLNEVRGFVECIVSCCRERFPVGVSDHAVRLPRQLLRRYLLLRHLPRRGSACHQVKHRSTPSRSSSFRQRCHRPSSLGRKESFIFRNFVGGDRRVLLLPS